MTIHKEGYHTIGIAALLFGVVNIAAFAFLSDAYPIIATIIFFATLGLFIFLVSFFSYSRA